MCCSESVHSNRRSVCDDIEEIKEKDLIKYIQQKNKHVNRLKEIKKLAIIQSQAREEIEAAQEEILTDSFFKPKEETKDKVLSKSWVEPKLKMPEPAEEKKEFDQELVFKIGRYFYRNKNLILFYIIPIVWLITIIWLPQNHKWPHQTHKCECVCPKPCSEETINNRPSLGFSTRPSFSDTMSPEKLMWTPKEEAKEFQNDEVRIICRLNKQNTLPYICFRFIKSNKIIKVSYVWNFNNKGLKLFKFRLVETHLKVL